MRKPPGRRCCRNRKTRATNMDCGDGRRLPENLRNWLAWSPPASRIPTQSRPLRAAHPSTANLRRTVVGVSSTLRTRAWMCTVFDRGDGRRVGAIPEPPISAGGLGHPPDGSDDPDTPCALAGHFQDGSRSHNGRRRLRLKSNCPAGDPQTHQTTSHKNMISTCFGRRWQQQSSQCSRHAISQGRATNRTRCS